MMRVDDFQPWSPYDPCLCGCGIIGWKLQRPLKGDRIAHVVGCTCAPHRGKANQRNGRRGEVRRHERLGGTGRPRNDEWPDTYTVTVTTSDKVGQQILVSFEDFVSSTFYRHAMAQAAKKIAIGNDAHPALYLEPASGGAWLLVDVAPRSKLDPPA